MDANKLWEQYNSFHKRYTAKYKPAIYKALQDQVNYYIKTKDLANLPQKPMQNVLMSLYKEVGRIWGMNTYYNVLKDAGIKGHVRPTLSIKRNGSIGLNEEFIQAIIDFFNVDLFNTVGKIEETTRKFIQQTVSEGIQQQLSLDEIIRNLQNSELTKTRAELIARTETMKGANAAADIGALKTGLLLNTVWISVRDKRTRFDHAEADNQTVPQGKPFVIGAERYLMLRPGVDRTTDGRKVPASEICNCRCIIGHKAIRGKDGLPLMRTIQQP